MSNRAAKLTRTYKVLKKHYKPYATTDRPVLEQLLYASCLQGATYDLADEAFAKLQQCYYDWNEVRVTTVSELSEVMANLPQPSASASQLKRTLQSVFESYYSFDLETLKKESIGKAVKQLKKLDGVSDFAVAFVTQSGFNGHSIPVTPESIEALRVLRVISDDEARKGRVPGLERAIPKNKGVEFGSLLHQLGADYAAAPFSPRVRAVMLEIEPEAKDRFPKRTAKKSDTDRPSDSPADAEPDSSSVQKSAVAEASEKPASGKKKKGKATGEVPNPEVADEEPRGDSPEKTATKRLSKKKPR
ncbi:MAG: hypothetical protein FJ276_30765 [Planctomycetes bacterium]|nr:hypothetical protein [Planctomycetota bacterium]